VLNNEEVVNSIIGTTSHGTVESVEDSISLSEVEGPSSVGKIIEDIRDSSISFQFIHGSTKTPITS
jgi:hypothetical protein